MSVTYKWGAILLDVLIKDSNFFNEERASYIGRYIDFPIPMYYTCYVK